MAIIQLWKIIIEIDNSELWVIGDFTTMSDIRTKKAEPEPSKHYKRL